jgi:serine/threonine-protein kinase
VIEDEASVDVAVLGRVIAGKYRVDSYLSGGAMGSVYRATHLSLDKGIAIKIMHRGLAADPAFARRFHREAKAASRLSHPNSIQVLDYGEERDGLLYIAMELVGGDNLRDVMDRQWPFDDARIVSILSQTLAAVAVAHEMSIVHRDLKPENILLVRGADDDGAPIDLVKVCDFGIAQVLEPRSESDAAAISVRGAATMAGALFGTPEYMSPEHARGERLDARADLYAAGVMLYEMLTASVPFTGESALAIVNKQITETPLAPSVLRPEVHRGLEAVCLRALTKDREQRYQTAREMRADLRAALGVGAARTSPVPLPERTSQFPTLTSRPQAGPASVPAGSVVSGGGVSASAAGVLPLAPTPGVDHPTLDVRPSAPNAPATDPTAVRRASHGDLAPLRASSWRSAVLLVCGAAAIGFGAFWWTTRGATGEVTGAQAAMAPGGEAAATVSAPTPATPDTALPASSAVAAEGDAVHAPSGAAAQRPAAAPEGQAAAGSTATPRGAVQAGVTPVLAGSAAAVDVAAPTVAAITPASAPPPSPVEAAPAPTTAGATPAPAPAAPKPTVSAAEIAAAKVVIAGVSTTGGLPASSVRSALKRAAFTGCYRGALKGATSIVGGTAQVVLSISDSGYVKSASVSMGFLPGAKGCIQAQAGSLKVANVDTGEATATVTLQFVPQ